MADMRIWMWKRCILLALFTAVGGLPAPYPSVNMTIVVPEGTSNHGAQDLLCLPSRWTDVFSFFLANYFAHAATVRANPGENWKDLTFAVVLAITFPFSGVARGLEAVMRRLRGFRWSESALRKAARAGALCIAIRDDHWQKTTEKVVGGPLTIKGVERRILDIAGHDEFNYGSGTEAASFGIMSTPEYKLRRVTSEKVHGLSKLPSGFTLAVLPSNADVVPNVTEHFIRISISCPSLPRGHRLALLHATSFQDANGTRRETLPEADSRPGLYTMSTRSASNTALLPIESVPTNQGAEHHVIFSVSSSDFPCHYRLAILPPGNASDAGLEDTEHPVTINISSSSIPHGYQLTTALSHPNDDDHLHHDIRRDDRGHFHTIRTLSSKLHREYHLAISAMNHEATSDGDMAHYKTITISATHNILGAFVGLMQIIYASYTLYLTRGDQIERYGYAAFGLTVFPYIMMTVMNLLGNLFTASYPTLYLVDSPELHEARLRGAEIDGVVGTVVEGDYGRSSYTGKLSSGEFAGPHVSENSVPRATRIRPFMKLIDAAGSTVGDTYVLEFTDLAEDQAPYRMHLRIPPYTQFQTIGKAYKGMKRRGRKGFQWWCFMAIGLGAFPIAVVGAMTRFQAAQSTTTQRVFTTFWLAAGVTIGSTIPFFGLTFQETLKRANVFKRHGAQGKADKTSLAGEKDGSGTTEPLLKPDVPSESLRLRLKRRWKELSQRIRSENPAETGYEWLKPKVLKDQEARDLLWRRTVAVYLFLATLTFSAGAIGGFVVVGQMLLDYGSCQII
jgi:hypothetical protein